jgi:hypothetical protein
LTSSVATYVSIAQNGTGLQTIRSGTAANGSTNTITLDGCANNSVLNFYKHCYVYLTEGKGAGQYRVITGYDHISKIATVTPAWVDAPDNTSKFAVLPAGIANVEAWMGAPVVIPTLPGVPEIDVTHVGGEPVCD